MKKQQEKEMINVSNLRGNGDTSDRSSLSTFWNYCNNAAQLVQLKSALYQLSPTTGTWRGDALILN